MKKNGVETIVDSDGILCAGMKYIYIYTYIYIYVCIE